MSLSSQDLQSISEQIKTITGPLQNSIDANTKQVTEYQRQLADIQTKLAVSVNDSKRDQKIMFSNKRSITRLNEDTQKANRQASEAFKMITDLSIKLEPIFNAHQEVKPYAKLARNVLAFVAFGLSTFVTAYITVEVKNAKSSDTVSTPYTETNRTGHNSRSGQGGGSK